jgi:hypothetical protein
VSEPAPAAARRAGIALRVVSWGVAALLAYAALTDRAWLGGDPGLGGVEVLALAVAALLAASAFARPSWNGAVLAIVLSTGMTLVLAELVARPLLGPRYLTPFRLDERRLYTPVPNARREYHRPAINGGDRIDYSFNADAFRGAPLARPKSALRVAVYGDSFIQAEYSSLENSFAEQLGRDLGAKLGVPIEIVNAGVAGYGPDQSLRRMQEEIGWLEPDLLVASIYGGNDFGDLIRNKLYRLGPDDTLVENAFVLDDELRVRMELARQEPVLRRALREGVRALRALRAPRPASDPRARERKVEDYLRQLQGEYEEFVVQRNDVVHELLSDPYNADVTLLPESDSARYKVRMMAAVMKQMGTLADAHRIPLLFVFIPHAIDATEAHASGAIDVARYPEYRRSRATDELVSIAQRLGRAHVDLFAPFRARGADALYFQDVDDHWNDAGQAYAAEVVADAIVSGGLLHPVATGAKP